ncbi:MAG: hypothetical protein AAFR32_07430 [Pseudomonadota bacterium]
MADPFDMPAPRDFGWSLKSPESTRFEIIERPNGQFCVVLNHSLLRGVTSEMIFWWFQNFANLKVRLDDTPGYEGQKVGAYLLWHPSDHCSASLQGKVGPNGEARVGASIHIQEAMQYDTYGLKYPVNAALKIFYCQPDGWAMGRSLPLLGKVMCLRIHFADVIEDGRVIGAHYHYEVVIGATGDNPLVRALNRKITGDYSPEFFAAWQRHNTIEVGTFENFLPPLFAQRTDGASLHYARAMDPLGGAPASQSAQDPELFERRVAGFKECADPFQYQGPERASHLASVD